MKRDGSRVGATSEGVLVPDALGKGVEAPLGRGVERSMSSRWVMIPPMTAIPIVPEPH